MAYIVHSLKHPEEVRTLREIYARGFYLFAVNAPPGVRKNYLGSKRQIPPDDAEHLMERDKLESVPHGQKVNQTFHLADFFVGYAEDPDRIKNSVRRFVDIAFGDPKKTPTFGEYSMFLAFAASLRSADLSRQVGAVIARDGEILSTGANDCPKGGGGLYWPYYDGSSKTFEDFPDGRDYKRGYDSNRAAQIEIVDSIAEGCGNRISKLLENAQVGPEICEEIRKCIRVELEDSSIGDLTEFGRVVHAEMEAILACSRKGVSTRKATIYCTTFPCHNCAKHIIASGINRVVFVEPYLKSKATMLHDEVIRIEYPKPHEQPQPPEDGIVRFEPFFGVGPRRFFDLFSMNLGVGRPLKRKDRDSGKAVNWPPKETTPRVRMQHDSYLMQETVAANSFTTAISMQK